MRFPSVELELEVVEEPLESDVTARIGDDHVLALKPEIAAVLRRRLHRREGVNITPLPEYRSIFILFKDGKFILTADL